MITCREFIEFVWMYLSGELPSEQRFDFDAHLAVCPSCVAYLKTYEETIQLGKQAFPSLDAGVPGDVPEELVQAILDAQKRAS